jgi:hypothetical protein
MLLQCIAALAFFTGMPSESSEKAHLGLARTIRWLTVSVYGFAAFHKLNHDFLNPSVSCASGGLTLLAEGWALSAPLPDLLLAAAPYIFLVTEIGITVLLVVRPLAGITLAAAVHVPLTIIFAPAFAFTMMPGWVFFLREDQIKELLGTWRRHWLPIAAVGITCGITSKALYLITHETTDYYWAVKETLMWMIFVGMLVHYSSCEDRASRGAWESALGYRRQWMPALMLLWVINALSPYAGLQFHRSAAMLSNLRIDHGCWNHLLVPEAVRLFDPYIRIESASLQRGEGAPRDIPGLREPLWSLQGLWHERLYVCSSESLGNAGEAAQRQSRVSIQGEYLGARFASQDICAEWPLPIPNLPRLRLFQTNLSVTCPQNCVH